MAKGDTITVLVSVGQHPLIERVLTASKAGRTVGQKIATRNKVQWVDLSELTRTGKETGTKMSFRLDYVVSVTERRLDVELPAKGKAPIGRIAVAEADPS